MTQTGESQVTSSVLMNHALSAFGIEADENGHCTKLVNNACSIYETRPDICRIDKMNPGMDKEEYYNLTARLCLELMLKEQQ